MMARECSFYREESENISRLEESRDGFESVSGWGGAFYGLQTCYGSISYNVLGKNGKEAVAGGWGVEITVSERMTRHEEKTSTDS